MAERHLDSAGLRDAFFGYFQHASGQQRRTRADRLYDGCSECFDNTCTQRFNSKNSQCGERWPLNGARVLFSRALRGPFLLCVHLTNDLMTICRHCFVSGRVQGVMFRATTARRAIEFKVTGYAKNLPDGRVEVLVCGEPPAVEALCDWLWQGPPAAKVSDVVIRDVECKEIPREFITR